VRGKANDTWPLPPSRADARATAAWAVGLFAVTAAVYVYGARPAVWFGDIGEFAVVPAYVAEGHYPGYPLLNQLYFGAHYVGGDAARAAGILNALFSAGAVTALFLSWRCLGVRHALAAAVALAFAFSPGFWNTATAGPDTYNFEVLLAAVVLFLAVKTAARQDSRYLLLAVFILALGLGNRTTLIAYGLVLVATYATLRRKPQATLAVVILLGVSVYMLSFIRAGYFTDQVPAPMRVTVDNYCEGIWATTTMLGTAVGKTKTASPVLYLTTNLIFYAKYAVLALATAGVATAFLGPRWRRPLLLALLAALAFGLLVFYLYRTGAPEPYILLPLVVVFTFAALGADRLWDLCSGRRVPQLVVGVAVAATPLYLFARDFAYANHRYDYACAMRVHEALRLVKLGSDCCGEHDCFMPYVYFRHALRARPDITLYHVGPEEFSALCARLPAWEPRPYGERGAVEFRPTCTPYVYFVSLYPGVERSPPFVRWNLPGESLAAGLAALRPSERFIAVVSDNLPVNLHDVFRTQPHWQNFLWTDTRAAVPLTWFTGADVVLVGRRHAAGLTVNALVAWGARRGRFACPRALYPPPPYDVAFEFRGDPAYGADQLTLTLGSRREVLNAAGVLFVALDDRWRPLRPAERFYIMGDKASEVYGFRVPAPRPLTRYGAGPPTSVPSNP
jgi:hypothetical protein